MFIIELTPNKGNRLYFNGDRSFGTRKGYLIFTSALTVDPNEAAVLDSWDDAHRISEAMRPRLNLECRVNILPAFAKRKKRYD